MIFSSFFLNLAQKQDSDDGQMSIETSSNFILLHLFQLFGKDAVQLPDILFCNLNPYRSNRTGTEDIPTPDEFYAKLDELEECPSCSTPAEHAFVKAAVSNLRSPKGKKPF